MRKAMYLMGALEDSDIEWLGANGSLMRLNAGDTLVRAGQAVDSLFVVLDGRLGVRTGSTAVATLLAGEVVGEISFVDARPPQASVVSLDTSRVLAIGRDVLQAKLGRDVRFAANFYRALATFLADRLRTTTARLGYGGPEQDRAAEDEEDLGEQLMETVSLGMQRFDNLLRQVRGA